MSNINDDEPKKQVTNPRALKIIDGGRVTQDQDYVDPLEMMNREWFVIQDDGGHCVVARWRSGRLQKLGVRAFRDGFAHIRMGRKDEAVATEWLKWPNRRTYERAEFAPGRTLPATILNLWQGFAIKPEPKPCEAIKEHIYEVLANADNAAYDYQVNWWAWIVQNPSLPPESALWHIGKMGAGKGFQGTLLKDIHGEQHGLHATCPDHFIGKHNEHLEYTRFLFADEAVVCSEAASKLLLTRITERTLTIDPKFKNLKQVPSYLAINMASNPGHVLRASTNERRCSLFETANTHAYKEETDDKRRAYFDRLFNERANGGTQGFLYFLLERDLQDFHPRTIFHTPALDNQKELTQDDPWKDIIELKLVEWNWPTSLDIEKIATDFLGLSARDQDERSKKRIRNALTNLGYISESRYNPETQKNVRKWWRNGNRP